MSLKTPIYVVGMGPVGQHTARLLLRSGYECVVGIDVLPHKGRGKLTRYIAPQYFNAINWRDKPLDNLVFSREEVVILCLPTPTVTPIGQEIGGRQDLSILETTLYALRHAACTVILRSTVLPTAFDIPVFARVDYVWPEFLHMARGAHDTDYPEYHIVGAAANKLQRGFPLLLRWRRAPGLSLHTTPRQAMAIKYLHNCYNATRIAFVNEMDDLFTEMGVPDPERTITTYFGDTPYLVPGHGFGGVCLPKDMQALVGALPQRAKLLEGALYSNTLRDVMLGIRERAS